MPSTFFCDYEGGSNAADGLSFANRSAFAAAMPITLFAAGSSFKSNNGETRERLSNKF